MTGLNEIFPPKKDRCLNSYAEIRDPVYSNIMGFQLVFLRTSSRHDVSDYLLRAGGHYQRGAVGQHLDPLRRCEPHPRPWQRPLRHPHDVPDPSSRW
jgi:hypothetical protein